MHTSYQLSDKSNSKPNPKQLKKHTRNMTGLSVTHYIHKLATCLPKVRNFKAKGKFFIYWSETKQLGRLNNSCYATSIYYYCYK